jgi:hypothetical protein
VLCSVWCRLEDVIRSRINSSLSGIRKEEDVAVWPAVLSSVQDEVLARRLCFNAVQRNLSMLTTQLEKCQCNKN